MYLKQKKKKDNFEKVLKKIIVIDVETAGLSARPESFVFGCAYGVGLRKVFYNVKEFENWLTSRSNRGKYIFAHNAEYDFTTIFGNIIKNLDSTCIFIGSLFLIARKNGVTFMNSLAVLKTSVEELGKNLGIEKLNLDTKFKTENNAKKIKVTSQDIEYCFRDCEIVFKFLEMMYRKTGKIKPTIASCAMEIFTSQYLKQPIKIHSLNEHFRNSYYGGRVECFRMGNVKGNKYDVTSLYPYVCTNMKFPDFENLKYLKQTDNKNILKLIQNYEGSAYFTVIWKDEFLGILPYRTGKETIFPVGKFSAYYNFNEIRNGLKYGLKIVSVKDIVFGTPINFSSLSEYMKDFFELKNTTKGAEKLINKFLLNALTGKFAEKSHTENIYFENIHEFLAHEEKFVNKKHSLNYFSKDRKDFFVEVEKNYVSKRWLIPTVSSYITSEARAHMFKFYFMKKKHLIYTDTDSLVISSTLNKKFIGDKLGFFKKENDIVTEVMGNKHYMSKVGRKKTLYLKGVPRGAFNSGKRFTYKKMMKTKEALRRNVEAGIFLEVTKTLKNDYTKRIVLKTGKTKPIKIK